MSLTDREIVSSLNDIRWAIQTLKSVVDEGYKLSPSDGRRFAALALRLVVDALD